MPEPIAPPLLTDAAIRALAALLLSAVEQTVAGPVQKKAIGRKHPADRRKPIVQHELREVGTELREAAT